MIINVKKDVTMEDEDVIALKGAKAVLEKLNDNVEYYEYIDIYGGEWTGEGIENCLTLLDSLCYQKGSVMTIYRKDE